MQEVLESLEGHGAFRSVNDVIYDGFHDFRASLSPLARRDELMVRHEEMPWQDRTTVVLDVRRASHTAASLERAVSAAAKTLLQSSLKLSDTYPGAEEAKKVLATL